MTNRLWFVVLLQTIFVCNNANDMFFFIFWRPICPGNCVLTSVQWVHAGYFFDAILLQLGTKGRNALFSFICIIEILLPFDLYLSSSYHHVYFKIKLPGAITCMSFFTFFSSFHSGYLFVGLFISFCIYASCVSFILRFINWLQVALSSRIGSWKLPRM